MKSKTNMELFIEKINNLTAKYPAQCLFGLGFVFGFIIGSIF
jgi:hypothetical protein